MPDNNENKALFTYKEKEFTIDKKSVADAAKIQKDIDFYSDHNRMVEWLNGPNGEKLREIVGQQSFKMGEIVTIKLRVVDPLFTNLLYNIMYGKSAVDGKSLNFLGFQWEELSIQGTATFTSDEVDMILAVSEFLKNKLRPNG